MQLVFQLSEATERTTTNLPFQIFCSSPIDKIQYKNLLTSKDVKVAYFQSKELNPFDNIEIVDSSWLLPSNNLENITGHYFSNEMKIISEYNELLFTDIVSYQNNEITPLWYFHSSKVIEEVTGFERLSSTNLVKSELSQGYKISGGKLYTNYENIYNYENDSFDIFLVTGKDKSGKFYSELLNLKPSIKKMEWTDIDPESGELKNSVFSQEQLLNGLFVYYINFPEGFSERICNNGLNGYFYRVSKNNKLELLKPEALTGQVPWNIRVQYAKQIASINGRQYLYTIPEYNKQPYNPFMPLIYLAEKLCFKITNSILKLMPSSLMYSPEQNIHIDILVFDYEEKLKKAYTSDSSKSNQRVYNTNIFYEYGQIESVDEKNGFVSFRNSVSFDSEDIIKANFFYYCNDFVMLDLNVNPAYNKKVDNRFVVYLKPIDVTESLDYNTNIKSLYFLALNDKNEIVYTSDILDNSIKNFDEFKSNYSYGHGNANNYLILGEVYYKDHSDLDDCFSFDLRTKNKFVKNEAYKENYRVLQSKFGYGERGQNLDRNNVRFLACSPEVYEMSEDDFLSQFNQSSPLQNIRFKNNPNLSFSLDYFYENPFKLVFRWQYQGPGQYNLSCFFKKSRREVSFDDEINRYKKDNKYIIYHLVESFILDQNADGSEIEWTLTYIPDNNSSYRESYSEKLIINI